MKRGWKILIIIILALIFLLAAWIIYTSIQLRYDLKYHCGRGDCFFNTTEDSCISDENCKLTGLYCYSDKYGEFSEDIYNSAKPYCNLTTNTCENICKGDIPEKECIKLGGIYSPVGSCA